MLERCQPLFLTWPDAQLRGLDAGAGMLGSLKFTDKLRCALAVFCRAGKKEAPPCVRPLGSGACQGRKIWRGEQGSESVGRAAWIAVNDTFLGG
jgi:hypothetical protein